MNNEKDKDEEGEDTKDHKEKEYLTCHHCGDHIVVLTKYCKRCGRKVCVHC